MNIVAGFRWMNFGREVMAVDSLFQTSNGDVIIFQREFQIYDETVDESCEKRSRKSRC
jgi:hypothetical protein